MGNAAEQGQQILILEQRRAHLQALPPGPTRDTILQALDERILALKEGRVRPAEGN